MTLEKRRLGNSDIMITPIGLGCWQFSQGKGMGGSFWESLPQDQIDTIVKASLDGGINWFDTAEIYGWGKSETALVQALENAGKKPGDAIIATKWYPVGRMSSSIINTIDQRIAALKGWPIDLHQIHMPWGFSTRKGEMKAMAQLLRDKKVRTVGVSNFSASQLRAAHRFLKDEGFDLVSNQVRYNLIQRYPDFDGTMEAAKELGITIIAFSPLAQGILTGKFHDEPDSIRNKPGYRKYSPMFGARGLAKTKPLVDELKKIAVTYKVSAAQVALNWLLTFNGDCVVAIPGATKPTHAEQNVGAMSFRLTDKECQVLDRLSS